MSAVYTKEKAMTTLSARYIKRPRSLYHCDNCSRPITGPAIRLYGMADTERPWTLRLHVGCVTDQSGDPKIQAALDTAAGIEIPQFPKETS